MSEEEKMLLTEAIELCGFGHWAQISKSMGSGRTPDQIRQHVLQTLRQKNGRWSVKESLLIREALVKFADVTNVDLFWQQVAEYVGTRDSSQCRAHYFIISQNKFKKKRAIWKTEEVTNLGVIHKRFQGDWQKIAPYFPGIPLFELIKKWDYISEDMEEDRTDETSQ